ncbi:hypothetical protein [Pyrobaculum aerophilum]|uniref:Uncharacterized protein n=1 Tax=Pyrobaculum aerophilum TaxID=13773 RepID=A0A371R0I8_9CREN|nr:hypothetical protein [Pyrobaculum aerophilum]MCX8136178.1 hypothetical protein [Pyrobaculum aerophilum]RFA96820.1 hypothetical protein CGL52_10455 [Pyrobaculum aerophilum]RFA98486.1 hypothetical protein CGL51_00110 [Pyrobaculum aerophilum]
MEKFDAAVGLAVLIFVALTLHGLWSILNPSAPYCGALTGYVLLAVLAGVSLLLSKWYRRLETIGVGLTLLYLVVMWATFANPGLLQFC